MATIAITPVEEYLAKTWRPDREYIDGEIRERNLGERPHSRLQIVIGSWLHVRSRQWKVCVLTEQRVQVRGARFRIPDISVIAADLPAENIITHPPLICIEVLSKDDSIRGMKERINDYIAFGVPNIWLFDPELRGVWICTADAMNWMTEGVLRASATEIAIPLQEIWDDLE
jgi:Uma2 family endonuclease